MMAYIRLLGQNHRRLPTLNTENEKDRMTIKCLKYAGWKEYTGPAKVDEKGWVIPDSDPNVVPLSGGKIGY